MSFFRKIFPPFKYLIGLFSYFAMLSIFFVLVFYVMPFNISEIVLVYTYILYCFIFPILVPIIFAHRIHQHLNVTLSQELSVSFISFIISFFVYLIPWIKYLWSNNFSMFSNSSAVFFPSLAFGITMAVSFLIMNKDFWNLKS